MKRKVILVIPQRSWASKDHLPSLGLGYVAAVLERGGYDVSIFDCAILDFSPQDAAELITLERPHAVGITSTSHERFWSINFIREVKKRASLFLFAGGPHFALTYSDALEHIPQIDAIILGEGEITSLQLLEARFNGVPLTSIDGIAFRDASGTVLVTKCRKNIRNLDALPDPSWHLFDLGLYKARLEGFTTGHAIGVMSSRGCPFGCAFCANNAFWRRGFRRMSPERFLSQLELLQNRYGFRDFDFWDDTFTLDPSHASDICSLINKKGLDLRFYLRARVDTVNKGLLEQVRKAGGVAIGLGIESGSQKVLDNIAKGITVEQAKSAVKLSIDLGFVVKAFFMTSLPGETLEDVEMTVKLVDQLKNYGGDRLHACYGSITTIYPGTRIEMLARKTGLLPADFSWNLPYHSQKMEALGLNPALPCFENDSLSIEEILRFWDSWHSLSESASLKPGADPKQQQPSHDKCASNP